jgi:hypothetical protein
MILRVQHLNFYTISKKIGGNSLNSGAQALINLEQGDRIGRFSANWVIVYILRAVYKRPNIIGSN